MRKFLSDYHEAMNDIGYDYAPYAGDYMKFYHYSISRHIRPYPHHITDQWISDFSQFPPFTSSQEIFGNHFSFM